MKRRYFLRTPVVAAAFPIFLTGLFSGNTSARDVLKADAADLEVAEIRVFDNTPNSGSPSWSPNGRSLVFNQRTTYRGERGYSQMIMINSDGTEKRRLALPRYGAYHNCSVSLDGKDVLYWRADSNPNPDRYFNFHIWNLSLKDFSKKQITKGEADDIHPAWSPDGKQITFSRGYVGGFRPGTTFNDKTEKNNIWIANRDGSGERKVYNSELRSGDPAWSPDGKQIAFEELYDYMNNECDIFVMNVDGKEKKPLTSDRKSGDPFYSPDGSKIVFSKNRPRLGSDICVMNSDGSNQTRLTDDDNIYDSPAWSPRGDEIALFNDGYISVMKLKPIKRYF